MGIINLFSRFFSWLRSEIKKARSKPKFNIGDTVRVTLFPKPILQGVVVEIKQKYEDLIGLSDFKSYRYTVRFRVDIDGYKTNVSYELFENHFKTIRILLIEKRVYFYE